MNVQLHSHKCNSYIVLLMLMVVCRTCMHFIYSHKYNVNSPDITKHYSEHNVVSKACKSTVRMVVQHTIHSGIKS